MRRIEPAHNSTAVLRPSFAQRACERRETPDSRCDTPRDVAEPLTTAPSEAPAESSVKRPAAEATRFADAFNAGLGLPPDVLARKQALMSSSPLKMARCVPALFVSDVLAPYSSLAALSDRQAPVVQIDGDCHFGNFGVVCGPDKQAVWGLNDHDMTCKGSPAFDLDRLAFSLVSEMRQQGFNVDKTSKVVTHLAAAYLAELASVAEDASRNRPYLEANETEGILKRLIEKADGVSRRDFIEKIAKSDAHGGWTFLHTDSVAAVTTGEATPVTQALHRYDETQGKTPTAARPLRILDIARKTDSGGSSFGQPRYWVLVENADASNPPIVLEVKQELPAPLVDWNGDPATAARASKPNWTGNLHKADAMQVVRGQAAMGGDLNPITGTTEIDGLSYLVREREPCKDSLSQGDLEKVSDFVTVAEASGKVLANAHARSEAGAKALLAWAGDGHRFAERLDAFAQAYATQAEQDLSAYRQAHPQGA